MASGSTWKKWGFDHPLGDFLWARDLRVTLVSPDEAMKMAEAVPEEVTNHSLVWGTPERIAQRCQQYIDAGITHLSFFNFSAMADPALSQDFAPLASEILVKLGGKPLAL
jgi:alkanesulfonate monooxygenase SsuD/methylene tetrahydromethanopterin reductase-like flavin-dependent oxidoreductase (luciferase family)